MMSIQRLYAITAHYLYTMKRNPTRLIEILLWPSLELILFSILATSVDTSSERTVQIGLGILSGIVFWNFFARIIQETVSQFLDDALSKNIQNIFITPLSLSELSFGLFTSSFIKMSLSFVLLALLLVFFYPSFFMSVGIHTIIWALTLIFFGCTLSLVALSFIFLLGERMSFIGSFISAVIQIFSCVFYDRTFLPAPLYQISFLVPSSYVFQSIRTYISEGVYSPSQTNTALALCFVSLLLSLYVFRVSYLYSKKTGNLVKI